MPKVSTYKLSEVIFDLRIRLHMWADPFFHWLHEVVVEPPLETIVQGSKVRLKLLGLLAILSHVFFGFTWALFYEQPYENVGVRLALCILISYLMFIKIEPGDAVVLLHRYVFVTSWLQLPVFFTWMYWMNGGNGVRQAGMVAMVLIYYQLTDWRLATLGLVSGVVFASGIAFVQLGGLPSVDGAIAISMALCCAVSIALAISSANLRKERLQYSLAAIGMMANELKTPIAAMSALGQTIARETVNADSASRSRVLAKTVKRINWITKNVRHQIDLQMMNARLMQLPLSDELISASVLVQKTVALYPFHSQAELDCVEIVVHEDFTFYGAELQYIHVLNNLIKNALHTLRDAKSQFDLGAMSIEIGRRNGMGRICVADKGMGIDPVELADIFEPFYSLHNAGSGLGLAFCKQVVHASGGDISVKSEVCFGSQFAITLPIEEVHKGNRHKMKQSAIPSKLNP